MRINLFTILHFIAFVAYIHLIFYILAKSFKEKLNRVGALMFFCFCLLSVHGIFISMTNLSEEFLNLANKILGISWIFISSLYLWFVCLLTEKKKILQSSWFYIVIFFIPVLFLLRHWYYAFIYYSETTKYGWVGGWTTSTWTYLFFVYCALFFLISLFLLLIHSNKQTIYPAQRKQANIMLLVTIIPMMMGIAIDVILPFSNIETPLTMNISSLITALGVVYAMVKHRLFSVSFALAADKILYTMADSVLLLNVRGKIIDINEAAVYLLGRKKEQILSKKIDFFLQEKLYKSIYNTIKRGDNFEKINQNIININKKKTPVIITCSSVKDKHNKLIGVVCLFRDITRQKQAEEEQKELNRELENKLEELEKFQKLAVGRELRMIELKGEIEELQKAASKYS